MWCMFCISFMVLVPGAVQHGVKCMAGWLLVHCVRYLVRDAVHMVDYLWCMNPVAWLMMQFTWRLVNMVAHH